VKAILVVDDETSITDIVKVVLMDDGYHVGTAGNGRHALDYLAVNQVDLILSDLMMPAMDGGALLDALRADPRYRDIPFVLMCSLPEATIADRVTGYSAFLPKPFNIGEVSTIIASLLPG